ncbi:T9SS type A sorting domain-containing protein [bacterium]|nr:T9SS type A sorting domain-containing protein [bacterium]
MRVLTKAARRAVKRKAPAGTIVWIPVMMLLCNTDNFFAQTMINTWDGTSSEDVTHRYTVTIDFQGAADAYLNLYTLTNVETATFSQSIRSHTITYSVAPVRTTALKDNHGNEYMKIEWESPIDSVTVISETELTVSTSYGRFISSATYPIESALIPDSIQQYLLPNGFCQSDASEIVDLADSLVSNSASEADAVITIVNWVRYNMRWICTCDMPFIYSDALNTLYFGGGNCVNFCNLALALLRAAGIPAREAVGSMIHDWTSYAGHIWVEAYYPDQGWIQFETSYWMPNEGPLPNTFLLPRHIKTYAGTGMGLSPGYVTEQHQTSTVVTSSPVSLQSVSVSIDTDNFVTYWITIRNTNFSRPDSVFLSTLVTANDWHVSLPQDAFYIDPDEPWEETRDLALTITPPQDVTETDTVTVCVTAISQATGSAEQVLFRINHDLSGVENPDGIDVPTEVMLFQNYPNPFNRSTLIPYRVNAPGDVTVKMYNLAGQEIETLVNEFHETGDYEIIWKPDRLPSGLYVYKIQAGNMSVTKKLIFQK